MSNNYYVNGDTLIDGQVARAAQVKAELDAVQSGFAQLPPHNGTGDGFSIPIKLPNGVDPQDAVNKAQLTVHDAYIVGIQTDVENRQADVINRQNNVIVRQSNVQSLHDVVVAKEALVNPHYTAIEGVHANAANVNTVSLAILDVQTVSVDIAAVVNASNNMAAIIDAPSQAFAAAGSASSANTSELLAYSHKLDAAQSYTSVNSLLQSSQALVDQADSMFTAVSESQAQTNALLGLGIGSSYVNADGELIMTYNDATVSDLSINAAGELILTY